MSNASLGGQSTYNCHDISQPATIIKVMITGNNKDRKTIIAKFTNKLGWKPSSRGHLGVKVQGQGCRSKVKGQKVKGQGQSQIFYDKTHFIFNLLIKLLIVTNRSIYKCVYTIPCFYVMDTPGIIWNPLLYSQSYSNMD